MQQNLSTQKWEFLVSTSLEKATADQIWSLFQDFFGLGKWFPGLATCHGISGTNGEPGCVRYCAGSGLKRETGDRDEVMWSKEMLVATDRAGMRFSYQILDSNIGFESYVSTVKVVPTGDVEWCVSLDPVPGWKLEDLVGKYQVGLTRLINNMENHISQSSLL